jgi:hypothetical protein
VAMKQTICGIYKIGRFGSTECYVGQSIDIQGRYRGHMNDLRRNQHPSKFMQHVYNKYGQDILYLEVLEQITDKKDKEELTSAEQKWIDLLNPKYNTAKVAGSCLGVKHSEETKEKHRQKMLGNKHAEGSKGRIGQRNTEEAKRKNSEAHKGRPGPKKGIPRSEETKRKISLKKKGVPVPALRGRPGSMTGKTWSPEHRKTYEQTMANRGEYHPSEETRKKISQKNMGRAAVNKGSHWWKSHDGTFYMAVQQRDPRDVLGSPAKGTRWWKSHDGTFYMDINRRDPRDVLGSPPYSD